MTDAIRNPDIEDNAEEMLIQAFEDGFIGAYAPEYGYERDDDGWLVCNVYADNGDIVDRYRVEITALKIEESNA